MKRGFHFDKAIAILALVTIGAGCSTCNYNKDVGTLDVGRRPLSLPEVLTEHEMREAEGWAEYAKGIYLQHDSPAKAQEHFKNALSLLPDSLKAINAAVTPLLEAKELDKALALLAPIVKQNPRSLHVNVLYAHILAELKRRQEAIDHLRSCCEANGYSELKMAIPLVGYLLMEERFSEAESVLDRLSKNPDFEKNMEFAGERVVYWHAVHSLAVAANAKNIAPKDGLQEKQADDRKTVRLPRRYTPQYCEKKAKASLEKLLGCSISSPKHLSIAGDLFSTYERWDLMWKMLESVEDESIRDTPVFIAMRLDALNRQGKTDEYRKYAQSLMEEEHLVSGLTIKLAECFQGLKDYASAIRLVRRLVKHMPERVEFRRWLAQLYISDKQYDSALKVYQSIPKLKAPDDYVISFLWREQGEMEKAYQAISSAEKKAEGHDKLLDMDFYFTFAIICEKCGKIDEALKHSRKAYEFDKENASACNFYGYMLADYNRELPFAKALITKALKLEPDNDAFLDSMAWVCYRLKEYKPALKFILKAYEKGGLIDDGDGVISKHAADICRENGLDDLVSHFTSLSEICQ